MELDINKKININEMKDTQSGIQIERDKYKIGVGYIQKQNVIHMEWDIY